MILVITCPSCQKKSETPYDRVPVGALKITCRTCSEQFPLDKAKQVNCRIRKPEQKVVSAEGIWKADVPACSGMTYDFSGILGLISSGLITAEDKVLPPGGAQWQSAIDVDLLQDAIRKKEEAVQRAERRGF